MLQVYNDSGTRFNTPIGLSNIDYIPCSTIYPYSLLYKIDSLMLNPTYSIAFPFMITLSGLYVC